MRDEMVVRVAKAINRAMPERNGSRSRITYTPYTLLLARAAIEAMREPTPAMVDAGVSVLWASGAVEGQLGSDELLVAEIFEVMADTCLPVTNPLPEPQKAE